MEIVKDSGKRPLTRIALTPKRGDAFRRHVDYLKSILQANWLPGRMLPTPSRTRSGPQLATRRYPIPMHKRFSATCVAPRFSPRRQALPHGLQLVAVFNTRCAEARRLRS